MASSALNYPRRYHVFPSFHGQDVRRPFLSHLHREFVSKGIVAFKDQEIERGNTIGPDLQQAIRESRVSIVVLSKNYASSGWCLDELVEILKCKEYKIQVVMTIFYDVDPSDVRKQSGDFGRAFETTCREKTEEVKQRWTKALTDVADIAGEHYLNWDDEGEMVEKIAADVSKKLNLTLSRDFEGMVGMEAHFKKLDSLLCLECDKAKMIGVWGPAGIGKTTIARALFNKLSSHFGLSLFMGNLEGGLKKSIMGVDDYDSKLSLQSQFLSKILNQKSMKIRHLGSVKEWLQDQKVLIVLDGVDDLEQLVVLANEPSWFDRKILKAHGINAIYNVDLPYEEEALEIFCLSAFKKTSPQAGFEKLAKKAAKICGNLPLGLCVVGSSLRGETKSEWELQLSGLENSLDSKIEDVLRVGYDKLSKKHQAIFLHIACFFNNEDADHVTTMLSDSNLDVRNGLKILADKSLVYVSTDGKIVMHYLLQQFGRLEVVKQSNEPGKRQFLVEAQDILNVLANGTTEELFISRRAFERMCNLQFLRVYIGHSNENVSLCTLEGMDYLPRLEDMEFLPRLRLLHWNSYPGTSLPPTFRPEFLIELNMPSSKFEKLWGGIQPLVNLKKVNLNFCSNLKEIPNLSRATNLETLTFIQCTSLMKFPSSIMNLYKLKTEHREFWVGGPSFVGRRFHVPESVRKLDLSDSGIERIPDYVSGLHRLQTLIVENCRKLMSVENLPSSLKSLQANNCVSLKRVELSMLLLPCFDRLSLTLRSVKEHGLQDSDSIRELMFHNCLRLDKEARRVILNRRYSEYVCLPGKQVPAEFTHKAAANSITISPGNFSTASSRFQVCFLLSPIKANALVNVTCYLRNKEGVLINQVNYVTNLSSGESPQVGTQHLFILGGDLSREQNKIPEVDVKTSEILFEFTCSDNHKIIECGVRLWEEEVRKSSITEFPCYKIEDHDNDGDCEPEGKGNIRYQIAYKAEAVEASQFEITKHTGRWSSTFLRKLGLRKI
ncbi:hypothetical protein Bca52824_027657 [Brassica carinata]|uniref:ADP-ribosyl cyclase/cyclic ADP-ribose hydrolase n=1 Tax=Brassica carinata TaxID=52824 RepID=A0A8X7VAZ8_BRACI|nr:hypothetical protein Bca52824_027657 [Brassica carinata]